MNPGTSGQTTIRRLQEYVRLDPENWDLRAELFDAALAGGDLAAASEQVEHARLARPDDAAWKHREATMLLASKRYPEAQAALEALIADGHDHPAVRHNLAWALFSQRRFEAARDVVAPLLSGSDETAGLAWTLWLRCQHRLYKLNEALDAFAAQSSGRTMPPDAFGVASLMAIDAGRLDDARALSDLALRGRKDQLEALATRGSLALASQDAAAAQGWFEAALRVNGVDGRSWSGLAFARMLKIDLPSAMEAFERAVTTMPDHIGTWIGFGWCQFLAKQPQAARQSFERALELDRNFAESHGALAVALVRLGEVERAKQEVEIALRLDRRSLSVRYAQAMMSGEAEDPEAFLRFSRRILAQVPAGDRDSDRTLADVVFGQQQR